MSSREPTFYLVLVLATFMLVGIANAQYWFQFGTRAGSSAQGNNGASVTIQTVAPQNVKSGSLAFWIGEDLANGAFIQAGYLVENETGMYSSTCDISSCKDYQQLNASDAEWFFEYFPSGFSGGFLGTIGPDGSAGKNGSLNTYAFYSSGNEWYATFDGNVIGSTNLGVSSSGSQTPVAFGEIANTSGINQYITPVAFQNLSIYSNSKIIPVTKGFAYIGYGSGSLEDLHDPYGVAEVQNKVNYFEVGSNLKQPSNGTQLWSLGYSMNVSSQYGNISSNSKYIAYSSVQITAPSIIQLNDTARVIFIGWKGSGTGAYTGSASTTNMIITGNITEKAQWDLQYYLNVTSKYNGAYGNGWYNASSSVIYGVVGNVIDINQTSRFIFDHWSNGNINSTGTVILKAPISITASWDKQFLVNATADYGEIIGNGWYSNNSVATLSVNSTEFKSSGGGFVGFYSWSNGNQNDTISMEVKAPVRLNAGFKSLYFATLIPQDGNGKDLSDVQFYVGNQQITNQTLVFQGISYGLTSVYYKGVKMQINTKFTMNSSGPLAVKLPIYNTMVTTKDILNRPVNSLINVQFSNGTRIQAYTGANGTISFNDVPYGYLNGTATYLGITQPLGGKNGAPNNIVFLSTFEILIFVGIIVAIAVAGLISWYHFREYHNKMRAIKTA